MNWNFFFLLESFWRFVWISQSPGIPSKDRNEVSNLKLSKHCLTFIYFCPKAVDISYLIPYGRIFNLCEIYSCEMDSDVDPLKYAWCVCLWVVVTVDRFQMGSQIAILSKTLIAYHTLEWLGTCMCSHVFLHCSYIICNIRFAQIAFVSTFLAPDFMSIFFGFLWKAAHAMRTIEQPLIVLMRSY